MAQATDPYASTAIKAKTEDPYAATASTATSADTESAHPILDWVNKKFANNPGQGQPGGYDEALRPIGNIGRRTVRNLVGAVSSVGDVATGGGKNTQQEGEDQFNSSPLGRIARGEKPSNAEVFANAADQVIPGLPLGSMPLESVRTARQQGPMQAATDVAGDVLAGYIGAKAVHSAVNLPVKAKDFVRGNVNETIPGSTVTPLRRFTAAKELGVNLDAADATNNPFLRTIKHLNENSLFGGHLYDNLKGSNIGALQDSTSGLLDSMYEGDRESGGRAIQDALKKNHAGLRSGAESGFEQLSEETKGKGVKGAPSVGDTAKGLLKTIEPLAAKYPSLAPGKTISVLGDLSDVGAVPKPPTTGFLDAPGSEFAVPRKIGQPAPDTWSDLQRLRSATHDLTTTNPDLVKSQALAPLQVMTSALDTAMTDASSGLTPQQQSVFRRANADWREMKDTYDNPSSPFHHAVRTDNPSSLFSGIGPRTPENAINLTRRLSPFEEFPDKSSDALGALRRGTVESALKENSEGAPNFPRFGSRLHNIPADYRAELFAPDQNSTLEKIAHTSNVLAKDFNPSGSGKLGQKVAEAAALIPTLGAPAIQYPIAKFMTSPRAVEWLMAPAKKANPFFAPVAAASTARRKRLE